MPELRGMRRISVTSEIVTSILKHGWSSAGPAEPVPDDLALEDTTFSRHRPGGMIFLFVSSTRFTSEDELKAMQGRLAAPEWTIRFQKRAQV